MTLWKVIQHFNTCVRKVLEAIFSKTGYLMTKLRENNNDVRKSKLNFSLIWLQKDPPILGFAMEAMLRELQISKRLRNNP